MSPHFDGGAAPYRTYAKKMVSLYRKMPRAGAAPMRREQAHAKWAARYTKEGDVYRAAAHAARAVEYRSAGMTAFGVGGIDVASVAASAAGASAAALLGIGVNALAAIGFTSPATTNSQALPGFTVAQGAPSPSSSHTPVPLGKKITGGLNGMVFHHKNIPEKVVKKFLNPGDSASMNEVNMYPVLSKIKTLTNGEFRTLNAEVHEVDLHCPTPQCLSIVMDKFARQTNDYISGDPKNKSLTADVLRKEVGLGKTEDFQKAIEDLFVQYTILHRFGVAHCDAHTGNSGLVVGAGTELPRFVIIDPSFSVISPLSEHWDQIHTVDSVTKDRNGVRQGPPVMQHVLHMMRVHTRQGMQTGGPYMFKLDERIENMETETEQFELLKTLIKDNKPMADLLQEIDPGVDTDTGFPYPGSVIIIGNIVFNHNEVIDKMEEDWTRLIDHIYPTKVAKAKGRKIVDKIRRMRRRVLAPPP